MKIRATFRTKLLLLTVVPLAVAQMVTLFAGMRTIEQNVRAEARDSLTAGAAVAGEYIAARTRQLQTSVSVVAADYGMKEAAATGDEATIRSVLDNHSRRVGADIAALVDTDGHLLASTLAGIAGNSGSNLALPASGADEHRESIAVLNDRMYHLFSVPLRAPVTVGSVTLGFEIGADLEKRISELTGLDVNIVRIEQFSATEPTSAIYTRETSDDQLLAIRTPFVKGETRVFVMLQRSLQDAMLPYVEARRGLLAFGMALLVFVAIAGGWFASTISRPLQVLGAGARRMISGDYGREVKVRSDDEFGELASSFNAMQQAIFEREQRISHNAMHDPLTDLPNRGKLVTDLTLAIDRARKTDSKVTVLAICLARLSEISSSLGHKATDELIKMVARHLQANIGDNDLLGQTGTNEFVLVLPGYDIESAMSYVDRIEGILASGVTLGRVNIILQTEIGIAEFPRHGDAASDLLRFAAIALSEAEASNERLRVYQPGREDDYLRRLRIVNDLPAAIQNRDIETWFQPKIRLPEGTVCGAEALVRWTHPELGPLSPVDFILPAEQSGTILVLTRHVIETALHACAAWQESGHSLHVSVNLSARDLLDEYLPYHIKEVLRDCGLPPERLTLEVTEHSIMMELRRAQSTLELLRDLGVRISMDDFGTGHSSLAQLRNIPLHELKIDKAFITTVDQDRHNEAIVRTSVELAHALDLSVVAEGVEDDATMRRVSGFGCEQAQGFVISKPMPASEFTGWLDAFKPVAYPERRGRRRAFAAE